MEFVPSFNIYMFLAMKMGWLEPGGGTGQNAYQLGPNLLIEPLSETLPDPRDICSLSEHVGTVWKVDDNILELSVFCNWRFIIINSAFKAIVGSLTRTLHVYSDVGEAVSWEIK